MNLSPGKQTRLPATTNQQNLAIKTPQKGAEVGGEKEGGDLRLVCTNQNRKNIFTTKKKKKNRRMSRGKV